jgi:hypothetical protein
MLRHQLYNIFLLSLNLYKYTTYILENDTSYEEKFKKTSMQYNWGRRGGERVTRR